VSSVFLRISLTSNWIIFFANFLCTGVFDYRVDLSYTHISLICSFVVRFHLRKMKTWIKEVYNELRVVPRFPR